MNLPKGKSNHVRWRLKDFENALKEAYDSEKASFISKFGNFMSSQYKMVKDTIITPKTEDKTIPKTAVKTTKRGKKKLDMSNL